HRPASRSGRGRWYPGRSLAGARLAHGGAHLLDGNRAARLRDEPLEVAHVARGRDHLVDASFLLDEFQAVAGLDAQALAHFLGDGDLALRGECGGGHSCRKSMILTSW